MKGAVIVSGLFRDRPAAAHIIDGRVDDFLASPPEGIPIPGTLVRGKLGRPVKGMGGSFVDLSHGQRGFLRQTKGLASGQSGWFQVTGYAVEGKAVPLTTALNLRGRFVVLTPEAPGRNLSRSFEDPTRRQELDDIAACVDLPEGCGMIVRSSASDASERAILAEAERLATLAGLLGSDANTIPGPDPAETLSALWPNADVDTQDASAFSHFDVSSQVERILAPDIPLSSGGTITIEPTRALVAVDVNTGADTSPAAGLKSTLSACQSLPRLLRVRGLGGQIVIDPAPFPKKDRRTVESQLRKAFRTDPISTTLAGWTPLGHFELQRRRERLPLEETFR